MNIRKVLAGSLAAITAGATLAFGAFASIGDLVQTSDSSLSSPIVVIGDPAPAVDVLGAADIAAAAAGYATKMVSVSGAAGVASATGGALVDIRGNKLNIREPLNDVKATFLAKDLDILSKGTITKDDGTETSYIQRLTLGSAAQVNYEKGTDMDEPQLFLYVGTGSPFYTYKVTFLGGLDITNIAEQPDLVIMDKVYTIGPNPTNTTMKIYGGGVDVSIGAGETQTVGIGAKTYDVKVVGLIEASGTVGPKATVQIGGISKTIEEGKTVTFTIGGVSLPVYAREVNIYKVPEVTGVARMFVGVDDTTLENDTEVKIGDETIDGAEVTFYASGDKITSIEVAYTADEELQIMEGDAFTDPVFKAFKVMAGGMTPELRSLGKEHVAVTPEGGDLKLTFTNADGNELNIEVAATPDSDNTVSLEGPGDKNFIIDDYNLTAGLAGGNISKGDYFVVSKNKNTNVIKFVDVDTTNELVKVKDEASGDEMEFSYDGSNLGTITIVEEFPFLVNPSNKELIVDADGNSTTTGTVMLWTENEAIIDLSEITGTASANVTITEPDATGDDVTSIAIKLVLTAESASSEFASILASNVNTDRVGDTDVYRGASDYGTFVEEDRDDDSVQLYIPDDSAQALVAVGSDPSISVAGVAGEVETAVKIKTPVAKLASEVQSMINAGTLNADVVLVGGPCANSLVATLAAAGHVKTCDAWDYNTGVIKEVADAFVSGKKALIVAGTDAADTRSLAAKVMTGVQSYQA